MRSLLQSFQIIIFVFITSFYSCNNAPNDKPPQQTTSIDSLPQNDTTIDVSNEDSTLEDTSTYFTYEYDELEPPIPVSEFTPRDKKFPRFERDHIEAQLAQKVATNQPLVVHVFVPLCDNEHQGIVPTTESLGNGFSLRSNLYWATSTGMKRYFKEKAGWKLLKSIKNVYGDSVVLERVVFKRSYPNQATVYLVADAYRGDKMFETVNDFLRAISNNHTETVTLDDSSQIQIHGAADLVAFNGHNGMLDLYYDQPDYWYNTSNTSKDMVVIACYANEYFEREAMRAKAYPLVRAISRLHPGAFVLSAIIDDWAMLKDIEAVRLSAGRAYCEIHDCSIKTSKKLFYKGWRPENLNE